MTEKRCHRCGKLIDDIMYWDNGIWCYCLDCSNYIVRELYGWFWMTELAMYFYRKIDEIITQINDYAEKLKGDDGNDWW